MKAIIPVAGAGTRLRPHTYTQPKALIPVGGKAILAYIMDDLIECGVTDFIFIIGYLGEKVSEYVSKNYPNIKVNYVEQKNREGLGHSIWLAKQNVAENEDVIIVLGDTIVDLDWRDIISCGKNCLAIKRVDDPSGFGLAELNDKSEIIRLVEKPSIPMSNQALVGVYRINDSKKLFDALQYNIENNIRTKDEFHLTDALQRMIEMGSVFNAFRVNNWFDCGKKEVLLETNAILLKRTATQTPAILGTDNSIIIQPVYVGKDCVIKNSIIGPNVAIGEGSQLNNCIIKDSIVGEFVRLEQVVLHHSVVGSDALIKGMSQSLNIGDNTEIDLSL